MTRDILAEATRALREETETGAHGDDLRRVRERRRAEETRERVLENVRAQRTKRRRGLFLVPLAAILIGSTAWASGMLPAAWHAIAGPPAEERERVEETEVAHLAPTSQAPRPHRTPSPAPVADVEVEDPDEVNDADVDETESVEPQPSASVPVAPPIPTTRQAHADAKPSEAAVEAESEPAASPPDPAAELYRSAHNAHFVQNNPSLALSRWNAYLAKAPKGRFVLEALYNRALCLIRLGQHGAAIAALKPFATGSYGAYRQSEAKRLVAALEGKKPEESEGD